jgi:glycosyltransferase involved in cell wall biosynthesis
MNILHATDFHNRANTGITFAVNELVSHTLSQLSPLGTVTLLSTGQTDVQVASGTHHISVDLAKGPARVWRYAPRYSATCEDLIRERGIDVVHVHGTWLHPQLAAVRSAHRLGIPTVLTNHGLVQWALRQPDWLGAAKKRLYMALVREALFHKVTVYHAITPLDRDSIRAFFPRARIEIIPNFIDVQKLDVHLPPTSGQGRERYMLYLGRLHPTKGVDLLIEAFGRAPLARDWRLVFVGPIVDKAYEDRLRRMIAASPHPDRIELREPVWDPAEKYRLMRDSWVTIVPSHTEVVSLVNLEASACFTPTITTTATGLTNWTEGGGLLVEPDLGPVTQALSEAARWSDQERQQRGLASRRLVEQRYSATAVMPRWMDLYRSLH